MSADCAACADSPVRVAYAQTFPVRRVGPPPTRPLYIPRPASRPAADAASVHDRPRAIEVIGPPRCSPSGPARHWPPSAAVRRRAPRRRCAPPHRRPILLRGVGADPCCPNCGPRPSAHPLAEPCEQWRTIRPYRDSGIGPCSHVGLSAKPARIQESVLSRTGCASSASTRHAGAPRGAGQTWLALNAPPDQNVPHGAFCRRRPSASRQMANASASRQRAKSHQAPRWMKVDRRR
jgi:hypothetical protein